MPEVRVAGLEVKVPVDFQQQLETSRTTRHRFGQYSRALDQIRLRLEHHALEKAELETMCSELRLPGDFDVAQISWRADYDPFFYRQLSRRARRIYLFRKEYIFDVEKAVVVESLATGMNEFLAWSKSQNKPTTRKRYKVSSKPLIGFFGEKKLGDVRRADIEAFKLRRMQQCSNAGTNRDLACLRVMFNWAMGQGYLQANLFKGVKMLPEGPGNLRIVSHEEERTYLANADPLTRDIATLIVETGMRPNEVYRMRSENVHLEGRFVFIPEGKTRTARRNVPLTEKAAEVIARRVRPGYLFPHRVDTAKPMVYSHGHARVYERVGFTFRLYDFRHTFGSRMAMAGVDLMTLRELMGHASITTTQRYCHPTPEHKREAVEKLRRFNEAHFAASRPTEPVKTPRCRAKGTHKSPHSDRWSGARRTFNVVRK